MPPVLQATQHPAPAGPAALPSWSDVAGPAGGFIALVVLLVLAGKGVYRLSMYGIDAARAFGSGVIAEWRRSSDELRGWFAAHAAEEVAVMREIRDSLNHAAVDRERLVAEVKADLERSAKETRHSIRNDMQVLASHIGAVPDDDSDPPPAPAHARDDRRDPRDLRALADRDAPHEHEARAARGPKR